MSRDSRALPEMVKAWIEHEEGRTLDEILEIEERFNAKGKPGWNQQYVAMCRAVKAALSESADALDAARYRWLREKVGATTGFQLEVARVKPWSLEPWSGGQLDLAVDTAIEKSRQAERPLG